MAALIVLAVDNVNAGDPAKDARCYKAGDVVDVLETDAHPGNAIVDNPRWRVIRVPDLSVSEARSFLAEEPQTDAHARPRQRRAFRLDLAQLAHPVTAEQVRGAKVRKPPMPEKAVR
jgi:hypothetical protein